MSPPDEPPVVDPKPYPEEASEPYLDSALDFSTAPPPPATTTSDWPDDLDNLYDTPEASPATFALPHGLFGDPSGIPIDRRHTERAPATNSSGRPPRPSGASSHRSHAASTGGFVIPPASPGRRLFAGLQTGSPIQVRQDGALFAPDALADLAFSDAT